MICKTMYVIWWLFVFYCEFLIQGMVYILGVQILTYRFYPCNFCVICIIIDVVQGCYNSSALATDMMLSFNVL